MRPAVTVTDSATVAASVIAKRTGSDEARRRWTVRKPGAEITRTTSAVEMGSENRPSELVLTVTSPVPDGSAPISAPLIGAPLESRTTPVAVLTCGPATTVHTIARQAMKAIACLRS